jgi:polar amino acid transport system substrate-binding protein
MFKIFDMQHCKFPLIAGIACALMSSAALAAENKDSPNMPSGHADLDRSNVNFPKMADPDIKAMLPKQFADKVLEFAVGTNYPPYIINANKPDGSGFMLDMARSITTLMGVNYKLIIQTDLPAQIPGIQQNKWQAQINGWTISEERKKVVDMISIGIEGFGFARLASGRKIGKDFDGLCGKTIAALSAEPSVQSLAKISKEVCLNNSKPEIKIQGVTDPNTALLAIKSGRADAMTGNTSNIGTIVRSSGGELVSDGPMFREHLISWLTQKNNGLAEVYAAAINKLIDTGVYGQLTEKYGLQAIKIDRSAVNPPQIHSAY